jgi:superfamily II DNA or RNA helicase
MALLQTLEEVFQKKSEIQERAYEELAANNFRGQAHMATGVGKTRLAILVAERRHKEADTGELLLVVPTVRLRDNNWQDEFNKWSSQELYDKFERSCYVSINKIKGRHFKYVILDEAHHITEANSEFFANNTVDEIIIMTATAPKDQMKALMLEVLAPVVFTYTLENGIEDGIIPPFWLYVVEVDLDGTDKYLVGGSKAKPFLQTERSRYEYLTKNFNTAIMANRNGTKPWMVNRAMQARTQFISTLRSKTFIASKILQQIPEDQRVILFCGSIAQAEELLAGKTYHSETTADALQAFQNEELNQLATVRAVNEGINIPNLDTAIIVQITSQDKDLIQRLGRVIRWHKDLREPIIYVIVARDTQDMVWFQAATAEINQNRIKYIGWRNFVTSLKPY